MKQFSRSRMLIGGAAVAGVMAVSGYAFTASNTVPGSKAGDGAGAITGYTVSSVDYTLNATDPGAMDAVAFTLSATPSASATIKVQVVDGGAWYDCTNDVADVTCDTTGATVVDADQLRVVAAD
jgi:hypothetical protein